MKSRLYPVVFILVLAGGLTAVVAAMQQLTAERIELNRHAAAQRAALAALGLPPPPGAGAREVAALFRERTRPTGRKVAGAAPGAPDEILEGRDGSGAVIGYAVPLAGQGFWDRIEGYLAIAPDRERLLGIAFYRQSETPGLGAEIVQPWFGQQFRDKRLQPADAAARLEFLPPGAEAGPGEVNGITGATGTSDAVERLINDALEKFLAATAAPREGGP